MTNTTPHHHDPKVHRLAPQRPRAPSDSATANAVEDLQLRRLASTVLMKSPEDMAALALTNPALFNEWIAAFREQKRAADAEVQLWSAAIASLATVGLHSGELTANVVAAE